MNPELVEQIEALLCDLEFIKQKAKTNEELGQELQSNQVYRNSHALLTSFQDLHHLLPVTSTNLLTRIIALAPETLRGKDKDGNLPLHLALRCQNSSPDIIKMMIEAYPEATEVPDKYGNLPLHCALSLRAPGSSTIDVELLQMLLESYPKAAEVQDQEGDLPLHLALRWNYSPDIAKVLFEAYPQAANVKGSYESLPLHLASCYKDIIKSLLEVYPKAVEEKDQMGELPLHGACHSDASLDALDLLLLAYPESLQVETSDGEKPSAFFLRSFEDSEDYDGLEEFKTYLSTVVINGYSVHLVKLLLEMFPESCAMQDEKGMTPLHHACMKSSKDISFDIIAVLVEACPESCTITNKDGKTPKQLLKEAAAYQDDAGMSLLHCMAARSQIFSSKSIRFVVDSYPDGLVLSDKRKMLPFHHACVNTSSSVEALMVLLSLYPDSIVSKDI